MRAIRQRLSGEWGFLALLALLCAVLSALQYHWTGEISRAEAERLRNGVRTGAEIFSSSFDETLAAYCSALTPARGTVNDENRARIHQQLFQRWISLHPAPIFRRVGIVLPAPDGVELLEQSLSDGTLSRAEWPDAWKRFRRQFEGGDRRPSGDGTGQLFEIPVFGGRPGDFGGPPESEWVVFELDTNYLRQVWLPELASAHLNLSTHLNAVVVETIGPPSTTLFKTPPDAACEGIPVVVRLNRRGRSLDTRRGPAADFQWLLKVYPQTDAMEKLVASSRRRNFTVAVALNAMILAAGLALARQTRKSRELAQQRMNFVAGVSHELRTPLTVIRGAAHNLTRGVVTERAQVEQYAGLILEHCEHLADMIEQVLALAGVQRKNSAAFHRPLALERVLRDAVAATAHEVRAARCEVSLELSPALPAVSGDAGALRRVFQNLIGNAVKHGGAGGSIRISAALSAGGTAVVEIQVADRGPGIPADERAEIFKPFFRGARARAGQVRGSGLGLSLAKEIVEAHRGSISVDTGAGQGATFIVRLPVAKPDHSQ